MGLPCESFDARLSVPDGPARDGHDWWPRRTATAPYALSDFERDATLVVSLGAARERGLASALIAVYRRRRAGSRHVGRVGERLEAVVLVERVVDRPSRRHGSVRRHDL